MTSHSDSSLDLRLSVASLDELLPATASLDGVPNELFEKVVEYLDCKSVCNLRLVNRIVSSKANQKTLQSFFRTARLNLTVDNLESFEQAAAGILGEIIENLHCVGLVYSWADLEFQINPPLLPDCWPLRGDRLWQAKKDLVELRVREAQWKYSMREGIPLRLLRRAFEHIGNRSWCGLQSLHVEVGLVTDPHKPPFPISKIRDFRVSCDAPYRLAPETFTLVMRSLEYNTLRRVRDINFFATAPGKFYCSVPIDVLSKVLDPDHMRWYPWLTFVRSLAISIVPPRIAKSIRDPADLDDQLRQGDVSSCVITLLQACPDVEILRLSFANEYPGFFLSRDAYRCVQSMFSRQIVRVIDKVDLPCLRILHLSGLKATDSQFAALLFAVRHTLQDVTLRWMTVEGTLAVAVAPLTNGMCPMIESCSIEELHVNDMYIEDASHLVHLKVGKQDQI